MPTRFRRAPWRDNRRIAPAELRIEALEERWLFTLDVSGNGNVDSASLIAAGGPGDLNTPGFINVGKSSTGNASVTYLGNGWVISSAHVAIGSNIGPITLNGNTYTVDDSTITQLKNEDLTPTDLIVFRLTTVPVGIPSITPSQISSTEPAGRQILIGNGLDIGAQNYWKVTTTSTPWVWTPQSPPAMPAGNDASGFAIDSNRHIRWGENNVAATDLDVTINGVAVHAYATQFDNAAYTGQAGLPSEAQASTGDSGGAVFGLVGGQWKLTGIIDAVNGPRSGQPASTTIFGDATYIVDLSQYRDQILAITASKVVSTNLFYSGSSRYDTTGNPQTPLPVANDNAIAIDKTAYIPGTGAASFANVSSYTRGINGLMVDIAGAHGTLSASDFIFRTGNNNSPGSWTTVTATPTISTRAGAGLNGSDRVEITFPDNAIQKTWLEVIVRGDDDLGANDTNTGLAASNVFFWGSAVADTGDGDSLGFVTNSTDEIDARANPAALVRNIPITNLYDFNRDGKVDSTDQIAARSNSNAVVTAPKIINIAGPPFAPQGSAETASSENSSAEPDVTSPMIALSLSGLGYRPVTGTPSPDPPAALPPRAPSPDPPAGVSPIVSVASAVGTRGADPDALLASTEAWEAALDDDLLDALASARHRAG